MGATNEVTHTVESEDKQTRNSPIDGSVRDLVLVDDYTVHAEVEDEDGEVWFETYKFESAEKARGRDAG